MIGVLAAVGVAIWLAGVVLIAALMPGVIRKDPTAQLAADLAPVLLAAVMAVITVAWPALPVAALLNKLTERKS